MKHTVIPLVFHITTNIAFCRFIHVLVVLVKKNVINNIESTTDQQQTTFMAKKNKPKVTKMMAKTIVILEIIASKHNFGSPLNIYIVRVITDHFGICTFFPFLVLLESPTYAYHIF